MEPVNLKNKKPEIGQKSCRLAEEIYSKLNQGSLFEIHQILNKIEDEDKKRCVVKVFIEKFNFNFLKYI